jgi:uncharacterized protein
VRVKLAAALIGVVFGVTLSWGGLTSPEVIRQGLLFQNAYLFEFFLSALAVATAGQHLLRRRGARAALSGEPVSWSREPPQRRHIVGSLVFGVGWGLADVCPGPLATQLGQGVGWALFTLAGVVAGVYLASTSRSLSAASSASARPALRK